MSVVLLAKCQKCDATREVYNLDWSQVMCVNSSCGAEIDNNLFGVYTRNPLIEGEIDRTKWHAMLASEAMSVVKKGAA